LKFSFRRLRYPLSQHPFLLCVVYAERMNSSLTVSLFLPLDLLRAKTARPFLELIFDRKPCLFLRFLLLG
jgi:hypothetical protein